MTKEAEEGSSVGGPLWPLYSKKKIHGRGWEVEDEEEEPGLFHQSGIKSTSDDSASEEVFVKVNMLWFRRCFRL